MCDCLRVIPIAPHSMWLRFVSFECAIVMPSWCPWSTFWLKSSSLNCTSPCASRLHFSSRGRGGGWMPWIPLDSWGFLLTSRRAPKAALRSALAHRLGEPALRADVGHFLTEWFPDQNGGVIACYQCVGGLGGQGSGVDFHVTYWSDDWRVQWLFAFYSPRRRCVVSGNMEFTVYPA